MQTGGEAAKKAMHEGDRKKNQRTGTKSYESISKRTGRNKT